MTALVRCQTNYPNTGANLVSIHSREENEFVFGLTGRDPKHEIWLGGMMFNGQFTWADGTPWDYVSPANDGIKGRSETRLAVHTDKKWHDWSNGEKLNAVVCRGTTHAATPCPGTGSRASRTTPSGLVQTQHPRPD